MARKKCRDIKELTERYNKRLSKRKPDYELVSDYNDKVVDIKHKVCGNTFSISPNYILYYGSCPACSKEDKLKKISSKEDIKIKEFKKYVKDITNDEYVVTGDKIDKKTRKINIKHICGYEYGIRICMFKKGRRCPICTKTKYKPPEKYKEEFYSVSRNEFELISQYKSSTEKIRVFHKICGEEFSVLPGYFLKDSRCPICQKMNNNKKI